MSANSPNPLVPQGSLQQQTGKAKANVRLAVFSIVAVHAVLIVGVLMQGGCKKDETKAPEVAGQPAVPADPFYSNPADLASNAAPTPVSGLAPTPAVDPFATNPLPPSTVSTSTPVAPAPGTAAPGLDFGAPPSVPAMAEPAPSVQQYTIVKNDNFYTIAKKLNTTAKKIMDANPNVDPARLKIGQKINVPVSATPAPVTASASGATASAANGATTTVNYEVKSGDTLYGIAKKFGTTPKAIQSANGMKTTQIYPGKTLKVPAKASAASATPESVITAPASTPTAPSIPVIPGTN